MHCGQYHIGIGRETTPWCYVFLLSHMHRLSVCKEDFSLTLEMTIREKGILKSLKAEMRDLWRQRISRIVPSFLRKGGRGIGRQMIQQLVPSFEVNCVYLTTLSVLHMS